MTTEQANILLICKLTEERNQAREQRYELLAALKRITTLVRRCTLSKPNLDEPIEGKYLVIIEDCEAAIAKAEKQ